MSASTRWLAGVGGVLLVAAVVSAAVALMASGTQQFDEGTPERTVQRYLEAVAERDATTALALMSDELVARCGPMPRDSIIHRGTSRSSAALEETRVRDAGGVEIRVAITESWGDSPFGGGDSTWSVFFELVEQNGEWRFSVEPWPTYCPNPRELPPVPAKPANR